MKFCLQTRKTNLIYSGKKLQTMSTVIITMKVYNIVGGKEEGLKKKAQLTRYQLPSIVRLKQFCSLKFIDACNATFQKQLEISMQYWENIENRVRKNIMERQQKNESVIINENSIIINIRIWKTCASSLTRKFWPVGSSKSFIT